MKESAAVVKGSQGSFLDAPTYPTHEYHVITELERSPSNRGSMSLTYAATCDYISDSARQRAQELLGNRQAPVIDSSEVQEWILQVLGYFRHCYKGEGPEPECWNASNLRIDKALDKDLTLVGQHAGVNLIRKFYPEFVPTQEQWNAAYWGTKKAIA